MVFYSYQKYNFRHFTAFPNKKKLFKVEDMKHIDTKTGDEEDMMVIVEDEDDSDAFLIPLGAKSKKKDSSSENDSDHGD